MTTVLIDPAGDAARLPLSRPRIATDTSIIDYGAGRLDGEAVARVILLDQGTDSGSVPLVQELVHRMVQELLRSVMFRDALQGPSVAAFGNVVGSPVDLLTGRLWSDDHIVTPPNRSFAVEVRFEFLGRGDAFAYVPDE